MISSVRKLREVREWLSRASGFFAFWIVLAGLDPVDLMMGAATALVATWASLRLMPPGPARFRPLTLLCAAARFLQQSAVAGFDIGRRALDPRLPLRPGIVLYQSDLPRGPMESAFCTVVGLLPGTLPSGIDRSGVLVIHCLDVSEPIVEQLATERARLLEVLGGISGDD
jgi:multicomponent Na+:H+ antiporter subunit E